MSYSQAIHDEVFRTYLLLGIGLLVLAGGVLLVLRGVLPSQAGHAWQAYRGWLVLVPLALGCVFLGRAATVVFLTVLALLGIKEYARATGLYRDWTTTGVVYLGTMAVGVLCLVRDPGTGQPGWYGLFMALPVYVTAAILIVPILRNRTQGALQAIALAIVGFLYIGWMFGHLAFLANSRHAYGYLLYLLFAVELSDVAAYIFGRTLGRHPLRSRISPNKTWEGSLGALAVSLALPWALHFSFPHFGTSDLVLTGLIVGIGGQLGDLSISTIKRDIGIKDMGAVIHGHGGILDRIDSLVFVAPLFFHITRYRWDIY